MKSLSNIGVQTPALSLYVLDRSHRLVSVVSHMAVVCNVPLIVSDLCLVVFHG